MTRLSSSLHVFVATLCLAAQGLVLGHYALVEHTRCAEHGELVHTGTHGSGHAGAHASERNASDTVSLGDAAHEDGHEHCATTSERRKAVCAPASVFVALAVVVTKPATPPLPGLAGLRAVYWIAPKTSPPV